MSPSQVPSQYNPAPLTEGKPTSVGIPSSERAQALCSWILILGYDLLYERFLTLVGTTLSREDLEN